MITRRLQLGLLASHPIQYHAPWFRALAKELDLHVFFAHRPKSNEQGVGFGKAFEWDVDLLSGYDHTFLKNVSGRPGVNYFFGCDTPEISKIISGSVPSNSDLPATTRKRFDAFVVCGWNLKCYWQATRACRRAGIPILVRGDSQLDATQSWFKRTAKQITHRFALRQFNGFLSPGKRNRNYLLHYGVSERKIFFVPACVDTQWFARQAQKESASRRSSRAAWNADDYTLVVLYVGKFQAIKRAEKIIQAVHLLAQRNIAAVAVLVGAGETEEVLRSLASETHVSAYFEGFRNQSELAKYYVGADVLVLPSERETWGLVVNEAMACGMPSIVSSAVGCAPDLIEEGKTGYIFSVGSAPELAEKLERFQRLRESGHDFQSDLAAKMNSYSVQRAAEKTVSAIREMATRAGL